MRSEKTERLNVLNALFGLVLEPGHTTEVLIQEQGAPYAITLLISLVISVFVPILSQVLKYNYTVYNSRAVVSLFVIMIFAILIFSVFERVLLRAIGMKVSAQVVFAAVIYSLTPMIVVIWAMYAANYFSSGSLTLVRYLVTGASSPSDVFLRVLPIAVIIAYLYVALVFFYSLKAMGDLYSSTAFLMLLASIIPFAASFAAALILGDVVRPGTIDIFLEVVTNPRALTTFY